MVLTVIDPTNPTFVGTPGNDNFKTVVNEPVNLDVYENGVVIFSAPIAGLSGLTINADGGFDKLAVQGNGTTTTAVYTPSSPQGWGTVALGGSGK